MRRRNGTISNVGDLDHAVILAADLDRGEQQFARLGFRTTPRGYHSAHMGTANSTVVLPDRRTYFELLGVIAPTPANATQRARLARRPGLHGLAFKTADARAAAAELDSAGLAQGDAVDFARAVELPDGPRDARFTVARLREDALPGAWCFLCQHHTPELVWRPEYLQQPNGARALVEIVGWTGDPDALIGPWRQFLGDRARRRAKAVEIRTGTATIAFFPVEELHDRFGDALGALDPEEPGLAALVFAVDDPAATRAVLEAGGIAPRALEDGSLLVPAASAAGVAILFRPGAAG